MAKFPTEFLYAKSHEWVEKGQQKPVKVGITEFASHELGDIVFVELPEVGAEIKKGETFGTVESVKAVSDLYAPVSGKVVAVNDKLEGSPELVNQSSHKDGWMIQVQPASEAEFKDLLASDAYEKLATAHK